MGETTALLLHRHSSEARQPLWRRAATIFIAFSAVFLIVAVTLRNDALPQPSAGEVLNTLAGDFGGERADGATENVLTLTLSNEYPALASLGLYAFPAIVEPHRTTTMEATSSSSSASSSAPDTSTLWSVYSFEAGDWSLEFEQVTATPTLDYVFRGVARRYRIAATLRRASDGAVLGRGTQECVCKYVRREIHTLTDADRAAFLDALYVVHTVPGSEGRARYGDGFTSSVEMTKQHLSNWHALGCSPYHNGDVFFTAHAAFASVLEISLQAVRPTVALPYWDYTYEGELFKAEWHKSELFSPKWFGSYSDVADGTDADYIVKSGALSYIPIAEKTPWGNDDGVETDAAEAAAPAAAAASAAAAAAVTAAAMSVLAKAGVGVPGAAAPAASSAMSTAAAAAATGAAAKGRPLGERNSYGRMTDWQNNSPAKMVARSRFICGVETMAPLANCDAVGHVLSSDSLYSLNINVATYIHNYLHSQLGGAWQCPAAPARFLEKYTDATTAHAVQEIMLVADMLWDFMAAAGKLSCPAHCSEDTPFEECTCHCPELVAARAAAAADDRNVSLADVWQILHDSSIAEFIVNLEGLSYFLSEDAETGRWRLGSGDEAYDHDLGVWLVEFACGPGAQGPIGSPFAAPNDPIFGVSHVTFAYYWDFKRLLRANGQFFDDRWSDDNTCSWGHHWDSELPFRQVAGAVAANGSFTNGELYDLLWPQRLGLPYVYDSFEFDLCRDRWDDTGVLDQVFGRSGSRRV